MLMRRDFYETLFWRINKMNKITINTEYKCNSTMVSNIFIDRYMPEASGSYVKVYLYLLRCLSDNTKPFSLSTATSDLDETEKNILRALSYWEQHQVLSLSMENNTLTGITLLELKEEKEKPPQPIISIASMPSTEPEDIYKTPVYTEEQMNTLLNSNDISLTLNVVEVYLERLLTPQDINLVVYLYDKLHFSSDLILHLYEYCIGKNKKKCEYIEKVAISWHKEGIDTIEKAQEYNILFDSCFNAVNKVFSLGRMPMGPERDFIKKWSSFHLPLELITEACNRTILNINKVDFKYTDRILENWYKAGISSLAEAKAFDTSRSLMNPRSSSENKVRQIPNMTKSASSYNNYSQRQYSQTELDDLESKLLALAAQN